MSTYDYDIVLLSDLRYPGGNSASLAEEIKAQSRAGYSTGLVHVPAPHMMRPRCFNPKIMHCVSAGLAQLAPTDREVRARALVIRQPRIFTEDLSTPVRVRADTTLLVVNHPPVDGLGGPEPYYDPASVRDRVADLFGETPWAPIGPLVRKALIDSRVRLDLRGEDWVNIVDVDEWRVDRSRFRAERPVIGRHSREHLSKWPSTRSDVLAAYPADDGVAVKILGGAGPAVQAVGYQPSNWTVYPFGSIAPQRFLSEIDFFVYYHHPEWVEAFGRNIVEGMASGCPAILPPHFERVFGESCTYAHPADVRGIVDELHGAPAEYLARSEQGTAYVEEHFSATEHVRRIRDLIGEPSAKPSPPSRARRGARRRILLVSLERRGGGSVARLARVAAGLERSLDPVLLAPWPSIQGGRDAGLLCELIPDHELEGPGHEELVERVLATARHHAAEAIVLDGHRATAGVLAGRSEALPSVLTGPIAPWSPPSLSSGFSATVSWDDVALRATSDGRPASFPSAGEPLSAEEARFELGLPAASAVALLCPGADARAVAMPRLWPTAQTLLAQGWSVAFTELLDGTQDLRLPEAVIRISPRPLWRYLRAFDIAVAAPGYTLTHELIVAGRPSLLVPFNDDPVKTARAVGARDRGLALSLDEFAEGPLTAGVTQLGVEAVRVRLSRACASVEFVDGAPRVLEALDRAARLADPQPLVQVARRA